MSAPTMVYLVEDHTDPDRVGRYWAHVYLSRAQAMTGVEHWARRTGHGPVRWETHTPVATARSIDGTRELYKVVPLRVHPEDQDLL